MNEDYQAHRVNDTGMNPPAFRFLPAGTFERWLARKGKLGGQHKVPRVISDLTRFTEVLAEFDTLSGRD